MIVSRLSTHIKLYPSMATRLSISRKVQITAIKRKRQPKTTQDIDGPIIPRPNSTKDIKNKKRTIGKG